MQKFSFLSFFISLLFVNSVSAQEPIYKLLQPVFQRRPPLSQKAKLRCAQLFALPQYDLIGITHKNSGSRWRLGKQAGIIDSPFATKRSSFVTNVVERILKNWKDSGHYTNPMIDGLRRKEAGLAPERTTYHLFESGSQMVGIRAYDGTIFPEVMGIRWINIDAKDFRTPIERAYNISFAERMLDHGGYVIELGLLSAPHFFEGGVKAIFHRVAQSLDKNYNFDEYAAFKDTRVITEKHLALYGIARPSLVPHYEALGFKKVRYNNDAGQRQDVVFEDGMYLIKIRGDEFIQRYFEELGVPSTPQYRIKEDPNFKVDRNFLTLRNKLLQDHTYLNPLSREMAAKVYFQLARELAVVMNTPGEAPTKWKAWRDFIEEFHMFLNSVPKDFIPYGRWYELKHFTHGLLSIEAYHDAIAHSGPVLGPNSITWQLVSELYPEAVP